MLHETPGQLGSPALALPSTSLPEQKAGRDLGQGRREIKMKVQKGKQKAKGEEARMWVGVLTQG